MNALKNNLVVEKKIKNKNLQDDGVDVPCFQGLPPKLASKASLQSC